MSPPAWLERLHCLAARFPELGIGPDLAALTVAEAWGLYALLSRLGNGA